MKLERISENQIRCTLTRSDLAERELKISELAYGTEKAKRLFRDMMQQAQIQFGFEADNIPLMIEAIPINAESIILIITKVEDPEELDTRFSKFAPFKGSKTSDTVEIDGADNIIDIFQKLCESKLKNIPQKTEEKIGKYDLNDFFLFYTLRYGTDVQKLFAFALKAYPEVSFEDMKASLLRFYKRFFTQQFKRSCLPDGPKVGSVTLSPRGDWRMPSDASVKLWLTQIENAK